MTSKENDQNVRFKVIAEQGQKISDLTKQVDDQKELITILEEDLKHANHMRRKWLEKSFRLQQRVNDLIQQSSDNG